MSRPVSPASTTSRRRALIDRFGRWAVMAGGMTIIGAILCILLFILAEVAPLFAGARVEQLPPLAAAGESTLALAQDEYRTTALLLEADGGVRGLSLADGAELGRWQLPLPEGVGIDRARTEPGASLFAALDRRGRVWIVPYAFDVHFEGDRRSIRPVVGQAVAVDPWPDAEPDAEAVRAFVAGRSPEGLETVAALRDGRVSVVRREASENFLTGELEWEESRYLLPAPAGLDTLALGPDHRRLFGGCATGAVVAWNLDDGPSAPATGPAGGAPITALEVLIGGGTLVAGRADGTLETWFPLRGEDGLRLVRAYKFGGRRGAIRSILASRRNKGFIALDADGGAGLYYATSRRTLWTGKVLDGAPRAAFFSPKADGALLLDGAALHPLAIDNPHPEVSLRALFGKVWYEGYPEPSYTWQSSGGSDDFEPKLSLVPLLIGTLKGTFYSLILAIPLGVFGAMYTSQFLHPSLKRIIKPVVEIMAALPSVVLGFLAGLWLAPRIERSFTGLLLALLILPLAVAGAGLAWERLPRSLRARLRPGTEVLFFAVVIVLAAGAAALLAGPTERLLFGGSFTQWLVNTSGIPFDQRNAIIVGLAMGFAVIPIIFSVSEDAFSNVPRNLVSGSLALGANRWQTVTRIVLPTASPGIFSAIMIGFGRAVGETMIVLMATGNTPIMDWNPFNGFRTLSANIAVEIPEAPFGGTLYRTLFLSALLLFLLTFVVNTAAEVVRSRLRRRYANL
ncbi:MAG: ABC transporter permease subunit [Acidobacteriota bacterium]|nr:ABC transporter permease subunit [Acidobacteriota bacterium]MDQ7087881.1 ABC transporter permease subunit [Acidobacteriota bacterium]